MPLTQNNMCTGVCCGNHLLKTTNRLKETLKQISAINAENNMKRKRPNWFRYSNEGHWDIALFYRE